MWNFFIINEDTKVIMFNMRYIEIRQYRNKKKF